MKTIKTLLLTSTLAMGLTACSEKDMKDLKVRVGIEKETETQKVTITVDQQMDSEQLAQAAEQLVSPYTFMLAAKAADMALEKDPSNIRAQLYKNLVARLMVFKGILTRIKPFVREHGKIEEHEKMIASLPISPLRDFLLDGPEDINSSHKIMDVLADYRKAIDQFRRFLRLNGNIEITAHMNPYVWQKQLESAPAENCTIKSESNSNGGTAGSSAEIKYTVTCDFKEIAIRKLNAADILALSQIEAGEVLLYTIYTSYDVDQIEKLGELDPNHTWTPSQTQAFLESLPGFGKLRADNGMKNILNLGSDFVAAWKWAKDKQAQLCPNGSSEKIQRKGYLFSKGICVHTNSDSERSLALLESALQGAIRVGLETPTGEIRQTQYDLFAWSRNPVADLRTVAPAAFDKCGNATKLRDLTMGGIYPQGDAELFLNKECKK
jgi:hypothetical protein